MQDISIISAVCKDHLKTILSPNMYARKVFFKNIPLHSFCNMDLSKLWKILFPDLKMQDISIISAVSKDHLKTNFKSEYVSS